MNGTRQPSGRSGFTLIELLAGIALMALLLAALLTFIFSMTEIWGQGGGRRLFQQHVNAVTAHVDAMLRHAALPAAGAWQAEPFRFIRARTEDHGALEGLGFTLVKGDRLLQWPGARRAPQTVCVLAVVPEEGLWVIWRSELEDQDDAWHETLVSPFVTSLSYEYYNPETRAWRPETTVERTGAGAWRVPEQIVLHFAQGKFQAERSLTLPLTIGGLPVF